ncbi:MAG: adenylate/guanylate cyclase domain-containing protein [Spirochaetales bacterium]|nr:adenylate/guanylate cyclase domain-containing protein [Spirochaetales bacterium]
MAVQKSGFFHKVGSTRVIPLYGKIAVLFVFFLLVSNFTTNYINLILNRAQQVKLMNELLVKELKENYITASTQFDVYTYNKNLPDSQKTLIQSALPGLTRKNSMAFGLRDDGSFLYFASPTLKWKTFPDQEALNHLLELQKRGISEGPLTFQAEGRTFFGYYKYHAGWKAFLVRAEDQEVFLAASWTIFYSIGFLILILTAITLFLSIMVLKRLFRYVNHITDSLMKMQKTQELSMIELKGAPNDDITYLGLSFNSLSATIQNLMNIFRKFVTQDVAYRAYKERQIRLEGEKQELTILFTDIKGFTYMTETLGNDIIKLLNLHYDKAIRHIQNRDGIVGSIIGDALLAVFGTIEGARDQRALKAVAAAYEIQAVAEELRKVMMQKRGDLILEQGSLKPEEERVFKAVMIEVGVGIDGGEVFYGNIGSYVRMTNTVIGDNVNSASRLEGLTRIYRVPVIVSESIKNEVETDTGDYYFLELDMVQVKGKTEGKKVFWPVLRRSIDEDLKNSFSQYGKALRAYYEGDWRTAEDAFKICGLEAASVFLERISGAEPPQYWNGVWTMTSK